MFHLLFSFDIKVTLLYKTIEVIDMQFSEIIVKTRQIKDPFISLKDRGLEFTDN